MSFLREARITHGLSAHYAALLAIPTRRALHGSELWKEIAPEVDRVTSAIARGDAEATKNGSNALRVVAWNVQRGTHLDALVERLTVDPILRDADVLLLSEVDSGMARSGDRDIARDLALALGMSYTFGVSYLVLEDDIGENASRAANSLALAGCAILSRVPIGRVVNVDVPELRDKFSSSEKRLGKKRALVAELLLPTPITVACAHLDSNASPQGRALQLGAIVDAANTFGHASILLGGDLNTTTYDVSSPLALVGNVLHKLFTLGFSGAIAHYMTPELRYERPIFALLASASLSIEGFNDRAQGTMNFDLNDSYALQKTERHIGAFLTRMLVRLLRPWDGCVPARLDWFAARALQPIASFVVTARAQDGRRASDHDAIVVDVTSSRAAT